MQMPNIPLISTKALKTQHFLLPDGKPLMSWDQIIHGHNLFSAYLYTGRASALVTYDNQGEDWLIMPKVTVSSGDSLFFWMTPQYTGSPIDSLIIKISATDSAFYSSFTTTAL